MHEEEQRKLPEIRVGEFEIREINPERIEKEMTYILNTPYKHDSQMISAHPHSQLAGISA
jgi:hypothetical protein